MYKNPLYVANILIQEVQFDPMYITETPIEDDNRRFQYTRTSNEINMVLDQQEVENSNSVISTQTNQQTSDTSTNRQNPDTNTFIVDTRTINTINSPTLQQEIDTDAEEQQNWQLKSDYLQLLSSYIPSSRPQIIPPQQE